MNCSEFKKEMNNFIHNTMDDDKAEGFIKHFKECSACNEELEIYYMINRTFNDVPVSGETVSMRNSYDFKKRLALKIAHYEEVIYHNYKVDLLMKFMISVTELISFIMAVYFIIFFLGGNNGL